MYAAGFLHVPEAKFFYSLKRDTPLQRLTGWFNGDFDSSGFLEVDGYGIIDFVINIQCPPFSTVSPLITTIPEPTAACGLAIVVTALPNRRRRR